MPEGTRTALSEAANEPVRVRLYHQLRTAHLERAAQLAPATILYGTRRYDFDDSAARKLDLVQAAGWRAGWWLARHHVAALEVNEPLYRQSVRSTALALVGLDVGRLVRQGPRPRVVTYAIENLDPAYVPRRSGSKAALARRLDQALAGFIWRRLDRIVYGTRASELVYGGAFEAGSGPASRVLDALPAASPTADRRGKTRHSVLFLGALDERKGIRQVLAAWPAVRRALPDARLLVLGKGPLVGLVESAVEHDSSVSLEIDPPRSRIHDALATSAVLVLPAQPRPGWKEQVGLPIVEGLSYGCTIVCTDETGLASWLDDHGHGVVPAAAGVPALTRSLVRAVAHPLNSNDVLASLPSEDGRLAADHWLFDGLPGQPLQGERSVTRVD